MNKPKIKVLYCTDEAGDHTADITQLLYDKEKEFDTMESAQSFIDECTLVRNLDEIYDVPNTDIASRNEIIPTTDNQLINED